MTLATSGEPPESFCAPLYLRTLGGLSIEADASDEAAPSLAPRRLALLAVVAAAGARGITRERIVGILWAETDEEQARHTLAQTLYGLRRETGREWITGSGGQLRLEVSLRSDVAEFTDALHEGHLDRAARTYTGSFLEGFYLAGAPEFERWVEETRARLRFAAIEVLESLARTAVASHSYDDALRWWRRLGEIDPLSGTYAAGEIRGLIARGDHVAALRVARQHEARVRYELDAEPDAIVRDLIATLRVLSPSSASPPIVAVPQSEPLSASADPQPAARPDPVGSRGPRRERSRARFWVPAAAAALALAGVAAAIRELRPTSRTVPFLAVGSIQSSDASTPGPMLRDMLGSGLARIPGVQVVPNSRLVELLPRGGAATAASTADAARRAGASELIEGELAAGESLVLTLRRVALHSGVLRGGYTVRAATVAALTDSATAALAQDLGLDPPPDASARVRTSSAVAYALFEQGLRAFYHSDAGAARRLMMAALERDSTFAMAAAWAWRSSVVTGHREDAERLLPVVRRLAGQTNEHERLWIEGQLAHHTAAPLTEFRDVAQRLASQFPNDPDGQILLGRALHASGDWPGSVAAMNRAIAIDSVAGATRGGYCRVCDAFFGIAESYLWWDSLPAAERSWRRLIGFRPEGGVGWGGLVEILLRQGRRAEAEAAIARGVRGDPGARPDFSGPLNRDLIRWGRSDELEARLVLTLRSTGPDMRGEMGWLLAFALRNQGRLREARALAADGVVPRSALRLEGHHDATSLAIAMLESGQPADAARRFLEFVEADRASTGAPGHKARITAWHMTLAGTALAAAGDTAGVRALADSVRRISAHSSFGRDYRLHHFLHGLLLQHQNRHAEAVDAFRRSLFSLTDGYTRTNLELARSLVALRRYDEAIAVLQPALRGGVDGGNTYVTHTELHEALALAFDAAGQRDSAAAHFAAVERAWRFADPHFAARYRTARARAASAK